MHRPRKRFGQHFLADSNVVARIVAALCLAREDQVIEIGPGEGALTGPLAGQLAHLRVVEIDRDLAAALRARFARDHVTVLEQDALDLDFSSLGEGLRVVGNLPYNISTPLLFRIAEAAASLRDVTVMLQKEVVDRMVARPGTAEYGRLSVMLQARFRLHKLFEVGAGAFRPPPKVRSAVVRLEPHPRALPCKEDLFARIVLAAFSQRRKTLRNALRAFAGEGTLRALGVDPQRRGETLSVEEFVALAQALETLAPDS